MFGKHMAETTGETVTVNNILHTYNTTRHKDWPNVWPCLMYTLLFQPHRFSSTAEKLQKYFRIKSKTRIKYT